MPRRDILWGMVALIVGATGLVLLALGLKDAAPFLFFGTEAEIAEREAGEVLVNLGAVASLIAGVAVLDRRVWPCIAVAAAGGLPAALLISPLDQSAAPGIAYVLLAPAAAAVLAVRSGLRFAERPWLFLVPLIWVAAAVLFVLGAGPIVGPLGALLSPVIFAAAHRLVWRSEPAAESGGGPKE